jgi:hypothetical protein
MCGSAIALSWEQEELLAAATIMEMLGKKRKWGGLVPRHVTYDREWWHTA